jgi:hypothetical protein
VAATEQQPRQRVDPMTRQNLILRSLNYELADIYFGIFVIQLQEQVMEITNRKHRTDFQV